jgi:5-formyltetrahydrofolate cyclo-ligase
VQQKVVSLPEFSSARTIAGYVAKQDEVQTDQILRMALSMGKRVLVPKTNSSTVSLSFHRIGDLGDLRPGTFGILEPAADAPQVPISQSDLVLIPVVAWDGEGHRVGYGKGYFDRELKSKGKAPGIGLAFESQRQEVIPPELTDVPLDMIVTEERVIRFRRLAN